jgi:CheY-like chemotaxis protein/two-component sensor histidine kinase
MKDQFLATLGHELRNPLAPIRNGLQILRRGQDSAGSARILEMLDRQIDHMVRLVDDLMEVARINSGSIQLHCQPMDIASLLNAALELSRTVVEKAGHTLTVRVEPGITLVNADEVRLAQVFSNLINNAAKYTPAGGRIDISVTRRGQRAEVMVRDTGIGFSDEDHHILFTPFGRLRPDHFGEGLGIGLALSKTLVGLHGGSISASSEGRDKGSCFIVSLPVVEFSDQTEPVGGDTDAASFEGHTVLVVDDNRDAADSFGELLRSLGCASTICYGAYEALSALEHLNPTIAFVDLGMPGMDGYQFAQEVRSRGSLRTLRLVALTGWSQPEDRARSARAGFDLHMVKPAGIDELIAVLGETRVVG